MKLKTWYDSGNLTELSERIKNIYKCEYNVLPKSAESICFFENYVIKFFHNEEIAQHRVLRGKHLYPLTPKILDYRDNFIKMKLINGKLVSQIKTQGEIKELLQWSKINLWTENVNKTDDFKNICRKFYIDKTKARIAKSQETITDYNIINNKDIGSINELIHSVDFDSLLTTEQTNYHGDFILDNIIKTDGGYKLLDWRQDFAGELYNGDKYYDLAKLRHNIIFNHENVSNNLYDIKIKNNNVIIDLKCNYTLINQLKDFDNFVLDNKLNLKKIKILTALIWLNMSPLHEYPLNEFLFYFGKYNLSLEL